MADDECKRADLRVHQAADFQQKADRAKEALLLRLIRHPFGTGGHKPASTGSLGADTRLTGHNED